MWPISTRSSSTRKPSCSRSDDLQRPTRPPSEVARPLDGSIRRSRRTSGTSPGAACRCRARRVRRRLARVRVWRRCVRPSDVRAGSDSATQRGARKASLARRGRSCTGTDAGRTGMADGERFAVPAVDRRRFPSRVEPASRRERVPGSEPVPGGDHASSVASSRRSKSPGATPGADRPTAGRA